MSDRDTSDAKATLSHASRAERQTRRESRWYSRYMLLMGALAFALTVAIEVFFPSGIARYSASAAWAGAWLLLVWWAESHHVHPAGGTRRVLIATAVWFGCYLVVIGPLVRWQASTSLGWWSVAAALMASPFLIDAWWEWRRS